MLKLNRKASSVMEYAIVLGVVSMALSSMSVYMKRGLQATTKAMSNRLITQDLYAKHVNAYLSSTTADNYLVGIHQPVSNQTNSNATITMNSNATEITAGKLTTITTSETIHRVADDDGVMTGWTDCLDGSC